MALVDNYVQVYGQIGNFFAKLQEGQVTGTHLHYNIQIHLPATKDVEVFNAIFKSLKEHLLE